jgi:hypothetical protein
MIELTPEQQSAIDIANGAPPVVVDRRTETTYVLIRAETFERLQQVTPGVPNSADIPLAIREARAAFNRDLPALLANRRMRGKYVSYHRSGVAAVAADFRGIVEECNRRGFPEDEYLIEKVVPGLRMDEEEIDRTFVEPGEEPA